MNHIYRIIFNRVLGVSRVVSENARSHAHSTTTVANASSQLISNVSQKNILFFLLFSVGSIISNANAACSITPGGSVTMDVTGSTCSVPDGNYAGNGYVFSATAGTIENTGDITLSTVSNNTDEFVRSFGTGAQILLNNLTVNPFVSTAAGSYGLHSGLGGDIVVSGLYTMTGSGTIWGAAAGNLGSLGTITLNDVDINITSGSAGANLITSTLASNILTVNGSLKLQNGATSSSGIYVSNNATVNLYGSGSETNTITMTGSGSAAMRVFADSTLNVTNLVTIMGTGGANISGLEVTAANGKAFFNGGLTANVTGTAVTASNGGSVTIGGTSSLTTSQDNVYGAYAYQAGSKVTMGTVNIVTTGTEATGIFASAGGTINVSSGNITTYGSRAFGLNAYNTGASITANNLVINTRGVGSYTVHAMFGGTVNLSGSNISIDQTGAVVASNVNAVVNLTDSSAISRGSIDSMGLAALSNGQINATNVRVSVLGSGTLTPANNVPTASAVSAHAGGRVNLLDSTLLTSNFYAYGIRVWNSAPSTVYMKGGAIYTGILLNTDGNPVDGSSNLIIDPSQFVASGKHGSHGVFAQTGHVYLNVDPSTGLATGTSSIVKTLGNTADGLYATGASSIITADSTAITTVGNSSYGAAVNTSGTIGLTNSSITTSGSTAYGAYATGAGSTISLADTNITTTGNGSYGVYANTGGVITLGGVQSNITSGSNTATTISGVYASGANAAIHLDSDQTNVTVTSAIPSGAYTVSALTATNGGRITTATGTALQLSLTSSGFSGINRGYGILALLGSVQLDGDTLITVGGPGTWGVRVDNTGTLIVNGNLEVNNGDGFGIGATNANSILTLNGEQTTINTGRTNSTQGIGLILGNGSNVTVNSAHTDINTLGTSSGGVNIEGGTLNLNGEMRINTQGDSAYGIASLGGAINLNGTTNITTQGINANGIQLHGSNGSNVFIRDAVSIGTFGEASHGFYAIQGAQYAFDGTATHLMPTFVIHGQNSAVLAANGANSRLTLSANNALNMSMTAGANTWGAKAETSGTIAFAGTSDTGGTGLWASNGTLQFTETSNAAGSHVKLDNTSTLNLSTHTGTLNIGSLEGSATSTVSLGSNTLSIGSNNATNNGSLINNADFAGIFGNAINGSLLKVGNTKQILSGLGNTVETVEVNSGTLSFKQNGAFATTGNYTTKANATTEIGASNSTLDIGGVYQHEADSTLKIILGASPDITADSAQLAGKLYFQGFNAGNIPVEATSVINGARYKMIQTTNGVQGAFDEIDGIDYLISDGFISMDTKNYLLGFGLSWNEGGQVDGTGNFTLVNGTAFNVDVALNDQVEPVGGFNSGWNGRDLKKLGEGELVLSAANTYTGSTTIEAGKLTLRGVGDIASSDAVALNGASAILDISGIDAASTTINNLSGVAGSQIILQGKTVQVNQNNNGVYAGDFDASNGSLHKTGAAELTLSGKTLYTGDTLLDAGQLTLDGSAGGAVLNSNVIAQAGTTLNLKNGAVLTGFIDPTDVNIDSRSTWNMTADSIVNTLNHAGTINMTAPMNNTFKNLSIEGDYIGNNGVLIMNTQLGNDASLTDHIVVAGNTAGLTRVQINNAGGTGAKTLEGIELIEVKGISAGEFKQTGRIVAGAYDYTLARGAGNLASNWYLTSELSLQRNPLDPIEPPPLPISPVLPTPEKQSALRPEGASYLANLTAANTLFSMNLSDRMAASKRGVQDEGGHGQTLWMRGVGGESRFRDYTGQLDSKSTYYSLQLGGDLANWTISETGLMTVGVMAGYGKNDSKEASKATGYRSEGSVSGYSVGIYGTWFANAEAQIGAYVDSWAQYNWFNNRVKGDQIQQERYDAQGVSASLEAGYRFKVASGVRLNYFVQPQAQVIWHGVSADDHRENNGTRIHNQSGNVLETRAGLKMSAQTRTDLANDTNPTFNMFVETNWIHRSQDLELRMDDVSVRQAGMGNVGEIKVGVESKLNQQWHVWGNLSHQRGSKGFKNTAVNLGLAYQF